MKYSQQIILKNGSIAVLRNGVEADGSAVFDNFSQTHAETDYLLSYPDENSFDAEQEGQFLAQKTASDNEIEIVAFVDGKVAGTAGIDAVSTKYKVRHRAEFGISLLKRYWGLGIGRALTEACIKCAKEAGYAQLELTVVAENERAITLKGALYRHYKNKRAIFDSIVERMIQIDANRARDYRMPAEQYDAMPDSYEHTSVRDIQKYTIEQLKFWTEDDFACPFRKMLTLEQYRNEEMAELYSQCLIAGPVAYMEDLFRELIKKGILKKENPRQLAVEYYAPLFLLISMSDKAGNNEAYIDIISNHTKHFI